MTVHHGVPVTTVVRTLYDLARVAREEELERALAEAVARRLTDCAALLAADPRFRGRPGAARLISLVGSGGLSRTRSEAETRFLGLVRRAGLPAPKSNVPVSGQEVDFYWRRHHLVVEVDGYRYHSSPQAFERDRQRDAVLAAAGIRVIRITWWQIVREHEALLVRLTQALSGAITATGSGLRTLPARSRQPAA